ncbi:sodium/proton-translocating pyrophosphatase, partial [Candidatus Soleaferrea massiliensis]|uniref:sodium/proton-translocating pyrophosphatase n=1 Tax=Candidatus Soleaferrea massiliensis TaxID=1470354 RepID=UPI000591834C
MDNLIYLAPVGSVVALLFAVYLIRKVLKADEGTDMMKKISLAVRKGANAYLKRQYKGVAIFFAAMFVLLLVLGFCGLVTMFVPFAFLTGGFFSALSGFIGMKVATASNARTANAAQHSLNKGLRVAFSAGAVMGFVVVGLGLLDLSFWFFFLKFWYTNV